MSKVLFIPKVRKYIDDLVPLLYEMGYFSYLDSSKKYFKGLVDDVMENLPTKSHTSAPKHFDKYGKGMKYASFKMNKRTIWYAFFKTYIENGETVYLVRYIANNHVIAQYL